MKIGCLSYKLNRADLNLYLFWKFELSVGFDPSELKGHCSVMSHKHDLSCKDFLQ